MTPTGTATPMATFPPVSSPALLALLSSVPPIIPAGELVTVEYFKDVTVDPSITCVIWYVCTSLVDDDLEVLVDETLELDDLWDEELLLVV